ncbi:FkbM family methyltransferase [Spirosoma sp. BT702]|uniref:FkbM family methyltransferase n=1 Tax=Spirosoma profusum TaxID=2771354 RepID=A0A926XT62_9BACT|nr:FkbM family methyltransferase [Spirosoma profusum]MBD2699502.1 FkbM family methyltransferase [Spirosoma profusum]
MAVTGINRYFRLWKHIANPGEYAFNKGERSKRDLVFTTRPLSIKFRVPESLYQLFKEIFMADVYEIDTLVRELPPSPVVLDIGANAGFFPIQLLSKIDKAIIYAYEPVPANVAAFEQTVSQNSRMAQSVHLFQKAVTGKPLDNLELFMESAGKNQVVASVFSDFHENNTEKITVPCTTLTDIIEENNLQKINLLKLDCEGSEYDIIYNTSSELVKRIDRMIVEVHDLDDKRNNIASFNQYVQSLGYVTDYEPINSFCYALTAIRK